MESSAAMTQQTGKLGSRLLSHNPTDFRLSLHSQVQRSPSPQQGSFVLSSDLLLEGQVQSGPDDAWAGPCLKGRGGET